MIGIRLLWESYKIFLAVNLIPIYLFCSELDKPLREVIRK